MIPEFVGRFNSIAACNELSIQDLMDILTKPKNSIIRQYKNLFAEDHVELNFTDEALELIAEKAKEAGTGARALRMIVENKLINLMYEVPSDQDITEILIDRNYIEGKGDPIIQRAPKEKNLLRSSRSRHRICDSSLRNRSMPCCW